MGKIGIYKITNPKGKVYVGQSINLDNRKKDYENMKCHEQPKLFNSIKKYSWENHKFEIIEECSIECLNIRERHWQDYYSSLNNGLNLRLTTSNDKSGIMSLDSSLIKSKKNSIPILQYNIDGSFVKEWPSLIMAQNELKINNINKVLRNKQQTAGNYIWKYKKDENYLKTIDVSYITNNKKPILQYDLENNLIREWDKISDAEIKYGSLSHVLKGVTKTAYGFKWKYKEIPKILADNYIPLKKNNHKIFQHKTKSRLKNSLNSSKNNKKIKAYYLDGTYIGEYDNPSVIGFVFFNFKIQTSSIIDSCEQKKNKTINNYIFQYSDNNNIEKIIKELKNNKRLNQKEVIQYNRDKVFIRKWKNSYEVEKELNIKSTDIRSCCNNKQKTSGGFIWEYGVEYLDNLPPIPWDEIRSKEEEYNLLKNVIEEENINNKINLKKIINIVKNNSLYDYNIDSINNEIIIPDINLIIKIYELSERWKLDKDYLFKIMHNNLKNNIKTIQIFSDEIEYKFSIVESRIINELKNISTRIYARKCIIKDITDSQIKNQFLNHHHIQGEDRSKYKFGLYYNDELVSLMTFNKPRLSIGSNNKNKNEDNTWELLRFVNKKGYNVIGGASKLLKHFIKEHNPDKIYSFSDNRWSSPIKNVYKTLGFTQTSQSKTGYSYTNDFKKRLHRFNFTKSRLIQKGWGEKNETESIIMNRRGYKPIYDAGTTRWEMIFK